MNIQEMIARQQAIVDGARAAGRALSAEEAQSSIICSVRSKMRRAIPPKHPKIPISTKRRVRQLSPSASASAISLLCAVRPVWIRLSTSATAPT